MVKTNLTSKPSPQNDTQKRGRSSFKWKMKRDGGRRQTEDWQIEKYDDVIFAVCSQSEKDQKVNLRVVPTFYPQIRIVVNCTIFCSSGDIHVLYTPAQIYWPVVRLTLEMLPYPPNPCLHLFLQSHCIYHNNASGFVKVKKRVNAWVRGGSPIIAVICIATSIYTR